MRSHLIAASGVMFVAFSPAIGEVVNAEATGFKIVSETVIDAQRADAWQAAINDIDKWWHSDHTVSGEARRLSISARPLGCFCEDLGDNAGVVHMTVTMVYPQAVLRLTGGLGPLGLMGVEGNMTWEFDDVGGRTAVTFTYAVGGFRPDGLDAMAQPVDLVISEALERLKAYVETGDADGATGD